jgi:flagellar basal body-associated protein FliL
MKSMSKNSTKINIVLLTILIINLVLLSLFLNPIQSQAEIPIDVEIGNSEEEVGSTDDSSPTPAGLYINPYGETGDITSLIKNIINFLIRLAIPITAILVVYAGYLYITSAGNEDKVKTAQKALIWALIGFGVVLIASSVPTIIEEFIFGESEEIEEIDNELPESIQI